jgi:predicted RNase H-like HicB family nuclease
MKHLQQVVKALITDGEESVFVGTCFNLSVVTQGNTLDEVVQNLKEAIELHFDGEDLREMGFAENPAVVITYEMEPLYAHA